MTSEPAWHVPEWTLQDRLRKSRESAGLDQNALAELMGTARNTVGNYEKGHTPPRPYIVKEWALVTGVPLWWLKGETPPPGAGIQPTGKRMAHVIPLRRAMAAA